MEGNCSLLRVGRMLLYASVVAFGLSDQFGDAVGTVKEYF